MTFNSFKSVKSKIFITYGVLLMITVLFSNAVFYYFAKEYIYKNTVNALKSISRDVIWDDIKGKNLKDNFSFAVHKYEFSIRNVFIQAQYNGKIVLKSKNLIGLELPIQKLLKKNSISHLKIHKISKYNIIMYSTKISGDENYTVQIATTTKTEQDHLEKIINMFLFGDPIFILFVLLIIYKMLQDVLRPMNVMVKTAKEISITDLNKRIPFYDNGDEFAELAKTLNNMFSKLQSSYKQIKQFSQDASHQLKTPLTSIRLQAGVTLKKDRDINEYKNVLKSIKNEITYLQNMINDLFLLAQMDNDAIKDNFENIRLDIVLMNVIGEFIVIANKKGVTLDIKDIDNTVILGDSTQISVLCSNLIDNAIKYTEKGKRVLIELKNYMMTIEDEGVGIEEKNINAVFDRFFRADSNDSKIVKGYGLGLSMVKIIANIHKADINIQSEIKVGTKITVKFLKPI